MLVVASIGIMFGLDMVSPGIMNRRARKINEPIINTKTYDRIFFTGLFMAAMALYLFQIGKTIYSYSLVGKTMALVSLSIWMIQAGIVMFKSFANSNKTGQRVR
jgi:Ca2+-transporting ATPase